MEKSILFSSLLFIIAGSVAGQGAIPCPPSAEIKPCSCTESPAGFDLYCNTGLPLKVSQVQDAILGAKPYGSIASLDVRDILAGSFDYIPDDFLVNTQIGNVMLSCNHYYDTSYGPLDFSIDSFMSNSGVCSLTGNLTIKNCHLHQFNVDMLSKCDQLTGLGFLNSHVESLGRFPVFKSLTNLTVSYVHSWKGASQIGLIKLPFTADNMLRLEYLDLTGNSLENDDVLNLIPTMTGLKQLYLEGNRVSILPEMKNLFYLDHLSITVNDSLVNMAIKLPTPRDGRIFLNATIKTPSIASRTITELSGDLKNSTINLTFRMTGPFEESVFLAPLRSLTDDGQIILNSASKYDCDCTLAWLIVGNPDLLSRVRNGVCKDGRPFEMVTADELTGCKRY